MERDYSKELDALQEQIKELRGMLERVIPAKEAAVKMNRVHIMQNMHPDERVSALMEELCCKTEETSADGLLSYMGIYNSGGRQSNWIRHMVCANNLFALVKKGIANKVLACIGSGNRLEILLEILRAPKTVAALTEQCGFGSTGQVYHHMKALLAADLIVEDEQQKGVYMVPHHKVQGVIMLLAGISDMVDETYTSSTWDELPENDAL